MSEPTTRFYREWIPTAEFEVPESVATGLAAFARAVFATDGTLLLVEMHTRKGLARVEYRSPVVALPGVPFDVRHPAGALGGLHWSILRRFDARGELTGFTVQLLDRTERSLMESSYDAKGGLEGITKSRYDSTGDLHYLFDYDHTGKLVDVYDRVEASSPAFEPVLATLPDRAFYADGRALPANVPPTPVSLPDEIVRRELGRPGQGPSE
jgi:hypothetical protein